MELNWDIDASKYLRDNTLNIPEKHLIKVCRCSAGESACRYIARNALTGFVCVKNTPLRKYIDIEVKSNPNWVAKGNNCDGFGNYAKKESKNNEEHKSNEDSKKTG